MFKMNKKGFEYKSIVKIVLWIVFITIFALGIYFLTKYLTK